MKKFIFLLFLIIFSAFQFKHSVFANEIDISETNICIKNNYAGDNCKLVHFRNSISLFDQNNYAASSEQLLMQKQLISHLNSSEILDLIWFLLRFECGDKFCEREVVDNVTLVLDSLVADSILNLKKLKSEGDYFAAADLTLSLAMYRKMKNNDAVDYETAKLFNEALDLLKRENLNNLHPAMIIIQAEVFSNGRCDYNFEKIDQRCSEFEDIDEELASNFIQLVFDNITFEEFKNLKNDALFNLMGRLLILTNDQEVKSYIMKVMYDYADYEYESADNDEINEIMYFLENVFNSSLENPLENTKLFEQLYEEAQETVSPLFNNNLIQLVSLSSVLSDNYRESGNTKKQIHYYGEFISHLTDFYNSSNYERSSKLIKQYESTLFDIIILASKIQTKDSIKNSDFGFELKHFEGEEDVVTFFLDEQGALESCKTILNIKDVKDIPFCDIPFQALPSLTFENISENSQLNYSGIQNGDILIAINGWIIDPIRNSNLYTKDYQDLIVTNFLNGLPKTELVVLPREFYERYMNLTEEERKDTDMNLIPKIFVHPKILNNFIHPTDPNDFNKYWEQQYPALLKKLEEPLIMSDTMRDVLDLSFQAAQFIFINQASNSFEKMRKRDQIKNPKLKNNIKKYDEITEELSFYQAQLLTALDQNASENQIKQLKTKILDKEQQISMLANQSPELKKYNQNFKKKIYKPSEISKYLGSDDILIFYLENLLGDFLLIVTSEVSSVLPVYRLQDIFEKIDYSKLDIYYSLNPELRERIFADIENTLNGEKSNFLSDDHVSKYYIRSVLSQYTQKLYQKNNIYFMTNIFDSYLPLSILPSPRGEFTHQKKYMVDDFVISNLISLENFELNAKKNKKKSELSFLGIADPVLNKEKSEQNFVLSNLSDFVNIFRDGDIVDQKYFSKLKELPDTSLEVNFAIKNFNTDSSKLLLRHDASETNVKNMDLSNYDVITFATHAVPVLNDSIFNEPGLILSLPQESTQHDDGYLTPKEISKLKIGAELVILSACNTASGGKNDSQILSGLAQAFIYAGAKSVIVSNWIVESRATTLLMNNFYENWIIKNMSISQALTSAKIYLRDNYEEYSHPAFWGAFTYYGI